MADITIVNGVYKPTNITGGHHPVSCHGNDAEAQRALKPSKRNRIPFIGGPIIPLLAMGTVIHQ